MLISAGSYVVGVGTDGASANIAARGLKGLVELKTEMGLLDVVSGKPVRIGN